LYEKKASLSSLLLNFIDNISHEQDIVITYSYEIFCVEN